MTKLKQIILAISTLALTGTFGIALADVNPQVCRTLVAAANNNNLPQELFTRFGSAIKPCLASCPNIYGNGDSENTIQNIANCRSSLTSLNFMNNYYQSLNSIPNNIFNTNNFSATNGSVNTGASANTNINANEAAQTNNNNQATASSTAANADANTQTNDQNDQTDNNQASQIRWF